MNPVQGNDPLHYLYLYDEGVFTKFGVTIRRNIVLGNDFAASEVNPEFLNWNHWRTPYLKGFEVPWVFYVHLNPIMYLGPVIVTGGNVPETREHSSFKQVMKYWKLESRVHLGGQIYIDRLSRVAFSASYVGWNYKEKKWGFHQTGSAPVSAVYPIIRQEEWIIGPPPNTSHTIDGRHYLFKLVIGLMFHEHQDRYLVNENTNKQELVSNQANYQQGDRYYARFHQTVHMPLAAGRVYEITEQRLWNFLRPNQPGWPQPPHVFAIYVCSGARLVVMDEYHPNEFAKEHNRSFVEQGGLIVGGYELYICSSKRDYNVPLAQMFPVQSVMAQLMYGQKKVVFLGANESEYNSITWVLEIGREHGQPNADGTAVSRRERAFLIMPEGGYVEGVENWTDGMAEVLARHQYERLHEPNVEMVGNMHLDEVNLPFVAPEGQMLRKILGAGEYMNRGIRCDYRLPFGNDQDILPLYEKTIENREGLPKQYNHRKCFIHESTTPNPYRPPVPPLYPPIKCPNGALYWMPLPIPETLVRPKNPDWNYKVIADHFITGPALGPDQLKYRAAPGFWTLTDEYEMERVMDIPPGQEAIDACDGINTRLGVDGWLYQKKEVYPGYCRLIACYFSEYYDKQ